MSLSCMYLSAQKNIKVFVKFICSEKATKFCEISTLLLSYVVEIFQNFVTFSEYMNFDWTKVLIDFCKYDIIIYYSKLMY